jgi:hypothetical protein
MESKRIAKSLPVLPKSNKEKELLHPKAWCSSAVTSSWGRLSGKSLAMMIAKYMPKSKSNLRKKQSQMGSLELPH